MERVLLPLAGLAALSIGFGLLEWRLPSVRGQRKSVVVASPTYHRWHHSAEPAAMNKNFAVLFQWDHVFSTLHLPKDRQQTTFGIAGDAPPAAFLSQPPYPFRSPRRQPVAAFETA